MVGVSQPTIVALEGQGRGRLDTLERVLETLGAGAYLAPSGQAQAFYTHAGNASVSHEWETPKELLAALHSVFGRFDLDPCAPRSSRTRVRARRHLTAEDDGLSAPWHGVVFVNPPYGRTLGSGWRRRVARWNWAMPGRWWRYCRPGPTRPTIGMSTWWAERWSTS